MLKDRIRGWCQQLLGLERYLFVFARVQVFRTRYLGHQPEFRFFMQLIHQEGILLDIGANIGTMTVLLARQFPQCRVYAFEPVPMHVRTVRKLAALFGLQNVTVFETALGNTEGMLTMVTPTREKSSMHGLSYVWQGPAGTEPPGAFAVPVTTLDNHPALQQAQRISAVKMDVENFEYYVLLGGRELLRRHRPVVFAELWNDAKRPLCMQLMRELGYSAAIFKKGRLVEYRGEDALNYFFLPGKEGQVQDV
ncbi:MAG: FkbM family methyltransferase [Bacteroidetes bacterium]|nr:FkbM family methyltransferase [Bacteroidota bacterium]